jgi:hypothetical protein
LGFAASVFFSGAVAVFFAGTAAGLFFAEAGVNVPPAEAFTVAGFFFAAAVSVAAGSAPFFFFASLPRFGVVAASAAATPELRFAPAQTATGGVVIA